MNITSITVCKNRTENLIKSLTTWLEVEGLSEIHIYDFCSQDPVYIDLYKAQLLSPKIKIFQTQQDDPFELAKFLNIALSITKSEYILKLDCDYKIDKDFLNGHRLARNTFYTGDWRVSRDLNENHLTGLLHAKHKDIMSVGGYNENIKSWGYEDEDLYERMVKKGIKRKVINMDLSHHIPHSDSLRCQDDGFDIVEYSIKNKKLSVVNPWSKNEKRTTGSASHASENLYFFSYGK